MRVLADTHVHLYSCYDFTTLLAAASSHMRGMEAKADAYLLCLTERSNQRVFQRIKHEGWSSSRYRLMPLKDEHALRLESEGESIFVLAGRQIVTAERIEVLALTRDISVPDGLPLRATIEAVCRESAVPVLPWSPGKWLLRRGKILAEFLSNASPQETLLGDVFIRPQSWSEPTLMQHARDRGLRVLAGSDPLPFPGDERVAGSYVTYVEGAFDLEHPSSSLRALLLNEKVGLRSVGTRASLGTLFQRLLKNKLASAQNI